MRFFVGLFFLLFSACTFPSTLFASEDPDFSISMQTQYEAFDSGITHVEQKITIKNLDEYTYTPSYSITLGMKKVSNIHITDAQGEKVPFKTSSANDKGTKIDITFSKQYIGFGKINEFTTSFDTAEISKKRGSIWEVTIPGIDDPDVFDELSTVVVVPDSFGKPSIIKPNVSKGVTNPLRFEKKEIGNGGVYIIYGEAQVYSYNLAYHISNSNLFPIRTEIALPPSTSYQAVTVDSLTPPPVNVYRDADGNWLAEYKLPASGTMDIVAKGEIEVRSTPTLEPLTDTQKKLYLADLSYWESMNPEVRKVASSLKTPRDIYNYVSKNLTYNYEKVSLQNERLGAVKTLKDPKNAVCLEFTDLFVALARAVGIPARAVEGYAYTSDERLRPTALGEDILHAWPEYYDFDKKAWVMVDPTWGNTTKGLNYFDTFDFDHIVFVKKGVDSNYPIPAGGYKAERQSRDIHISFAKDSTLSKRSQSALLSVIPQDAISSMPISGKATIKNIGNVPLVQKKLSVQSELGLQQSEFVIDYIPPFGEKTVDLQFEKVPLLTNQSYKVTMLFEGITDTKLLSVQIIPLYVLYILGGTIGVIIITLSIIALKPWRLFIQRPDREDSLRGESKGP